MHKKKKKKKSEKNIGPRRNVRGFYWCVKSCCSHFKLIPCYSWSIISPYAKFDPNWTKNTQVGNFHFWLIGLVGRKMVVGISNSFYVVFAPLLAPKKNFIQIGQKIRKLEIFIFWSILVGRAGSSKNGCKHIRLILCCFCPIIIPHTKFHPNRTKNRS